MYLEDLYIILHERRGAGLNPGTQQGSLETIMAKSGRSKCKRISISSEGRKLRLTRKKSMEKVDAETGDSE